MAHVMIIAEAGVNHNGDTETAKKLIDAAVGAGANVVKFQTFKAKNIVTKAAQRAEYQKHASQLNESHYDMLKRLELTREMHLELIDYCKKSGIEFLSTPFDIDSICELEGLDIKRWKIPSGEITNLPYLEAISKTRKPVILSTGMSDLKEILRAIDILKNNGDGCTDITVLHCNTQYPTPFEQVNLRAMKTIAEATGLPVGYSDHTLGTEVPIAAVAMGATIIEKHFTLDRNMEGPDHKASLEPDELRSMVKAIRNIEKAVGNDIKEVTSSEKENMIIARKSIVAKCNIKKGDFFTENNITTKRPGTGISPMRWHEILGQTAIRDFAEDDLIEI